MRDYKQVSGIPMWEHLGRLYVRVETFAGYAARSEPNLASALLKEVVKEDEGMDE